MAVANLDDALPNTRELDEWMGRIDRRLDEEAVGTDVSAVPQLAPAQRTAPVPIAARGEDAQMATLERVLAEVRSMRAEVAAMASMPSEVETLRREVYAVKQVLGRIREMSAARRRLLSS